MATKLAMTVSVLLLLCAWPVQTQGAVVSVGGHLSARDAFQHEIFFNPSLVAQ